MPCQIEKPFGEVETRELMGGTEANSVFIDAGSLIFSYLPLPQYLIAGALPHTFAGRGGEDALRSIIYNKYSVTATSNCQSTVLLCVQRAKTLLLLESSS